MLKPVTFKSFDNCRKALGYKYRNECQRIFVQEAMATNKVIIQAYRQFMKSFFCALLGANYTAFGGTSIIAAPTLNQATRIIYRNSKVNTDGLLDYASNKVRKEPDTTTETIWENGGYLLALSARDVESREDKVKKPEGYTGHLLILDEGHMVHEKMVGVFTPMLSDARSAGLARVVISGVGGYKTMAIEAMKTRGYTTVRMTASRALEIDPTLKPLFDEYREELSDWEWAKYYECEETAYGLKHMYTNLPGYIENDGRFDQRAHFIFGIDVGRRKDYTVVKVLQVNGEGEMSLKNEIETYKVGHKPMREQAKEIYTWVNQRYPNQWYAGNIVCELNGIGKDLHDELCLTRFGPGVAGYDINADMKEQVWHQTNREARNGTFGVADPVERGIYENLMYNARESDGKLEFEHSDEWSALVMAWIGTSEIESM